MDVKKVNDTKDKIIDMIRSHGPSFPTRISKETGISPLFIGALLSEMVAENKLVMSNMRVGSSPLYYIKGQEEMLEKFIKYLNSKERETVEKLKQFGVIEDAQQDPATRVALRKIKDFANAIIIKTDKEEKLFWKFFTLSDEKSKSIIENIIKNKKNEDYTKENIKKETEIETERFKEKIDSEIKKKEKKIENKKTNDFINKIKEYLSNKNIEILEDISEKQKEYCGKVKINTIFGKQEYFLMAKNKKKISENDLTIILHRAQNEKMPAIMISDGEMDKNAKTYFEQWKNLIKFEKIKF